MFTVKIIETGFEKREVREYQKLADSGGKDGGAEYGYAGEVRDVAFEREVFSCKRNEVDSGAVIAAIFGMKRK